MIEADVLSFGGRLFLWLCLYTLLLLGYAGLEQGVIARFQQRRSAQGWAAFRPAIVGVGSVAALIFALLAALIIPLCPDLLFFGQIVKGHVLGELELGVLVSLAANGAGEVLLILASRPQGAQCWRSTPWERVGRLLLHALPAMLVLCSLLLTVSVLSGGQVSGLRPTDLIAMQQAYNGLRWLVLLQPVAWGLWMVCAAAGTGPARQTLAGRVLGLNRALLASMLFFGGWQGPFVARLSWLGVLYTALKVAALAFVWTWLHASLPAPPFSVGQRRMWRVLVPVSLINLVVTALIVIV